MSDQIKLIHYFASEEAYNEALLKPPATAWLKSRDIGGGKKSGYLPIHNQEAIADLMFRQWEVVDEKYFVVVNEICCTIKLRILPDYPDAEERFPTGSAANPIQTDSGSTASHFPTGKKSNSLQYNLPAVRSLAISNCLETLGNVFGRNVSRTAANSFKVDKAPKDDVKK